MRGEIKLELAAHELLAAQLSQKHLAGQRIPVTIDGVECVAFLVRATYHSDNYRTFELVLCSEPITPSANVIDGAAERVADQKKLPGK